MEEENQNSSTDTIKQLTGYLPMLSFIAFGYGIITNYIYYSHFNIDILDYADWNELIMAILQPLCLYVIPITFIVFSILYFMLRYDQKKLKAFDTEDRIEYYRNKAKLYTRISGILTIFSLSTLTGFYLYTRYISNITEPLLLKAVLTMSAFLIVSHFGLILRMRHGEYLSKEKNANYIFALGYILTLLWIVAIFVPIRNIIHVQADDSIAITFRFEKKTITTSLDTIYLGRTKNYIFIYNKIDKECITYSTNNLVAIDKKEK